MTGTRIRPGEHRRSVVPTRSSARPSGRHAFPEVAKTLARSWRPKSADTPRDPAVALFTAYVLLWLLEGALRKWIAPGLQQPLFFVRLPFAVLIILVGLARVRRPWNGLAQLAALVTLAMVTYAGVRGLQGDESAGTAIYGLRMYLELLLVPVAAATFMRVVDAEQCMRLLLWLSLPISVLTFLQVRSPGSARINRIFAADGGDNLTSTGGVVRATGTFTAPSGHVFYIALCVTCLLVLAFRRDAAPRLLLWSSTFAVLLMIVTSGSRSGIFLSAIPFVGALLIRFVHRPGRSVALLGGVAAVLTLTYAFANAAAPSVIAAFTKRFSNTAASEDTPARVLGTAKGFLEPLKTADLFGAGPGAYLQGRVAVGVEDELSRWVLELGIVGFLLAVAVRWGLVAHIGVRAIRALRTRGDDGALIMWIGGLFTLLFGQVTSQGTLLGYGVITLILATALTTTTDDASVSVPTLPVDRAANPPPRNMRSADNVQR